MLKSCELPNQSGRSIEGRGENEITHTENAQEHNEHFHNKVPNLKKLKPKNIIFNKKQVCNSIYQTSKIYTHFIT